MSKSWFCGCFDFALQMLSNLFVRFWNSTKDVVPVLVVLCDSVAQVLEIRIRVGLAITYKHHSLEAIFSLWSYKLFVTTDNSVIFEQISHHAEHA